MSRSATGISPVKVDNPNLIPVIFFLFITVQCKKILGICEKFVYKNTSFKKSYNILETENHPADMERVVKHKPAGSYP